MTIQHLIHKINKEFILIIWISNCEIFQIRFYCNSFIIASFFYELLRYNTTMLRLQ